MWANPTAWCAGEMHVVHLKRPFLLPRVRYHRSWKGAGGLTSTQVVLSCLTLIERTNVNCIQHLGNSLCSGRRSRSQSSSFIAVRQRAGPRHQPAEHKAAAVVGPQEECKVGNLYHLATQYYSSLLELWWMPWWTSASMAAKCAQKGQQRCVPILRKQKDVQA